jgi:hypothetical protein
MAIDELAPGSSHERQARAAAWAGGAGSGGRGGARPQGERMTILGIDPGKSGAIAVLDEGGELLKVHDTPSTLEPNGRSAPNAPGQKPHRQIAHPIIVDELRPAPTAQQ